MIRVATMSGRSVKVREKKRQTSGKVMKKWGVLKKKSGNLI